MFLDEVTWGGIRPNGDRLKVLITESTQRCSAKYEPTTMTESFVNVVIAGNNEWIAPVEANHRRGPLLALSDQYSGKKTAASKAYFEAIAAAPAAAIAFILYSMDLEDFQPSMYVATALERDQQTRSFDTVHHWWDTCLAEGTIDGVDVYPDVERAAPPDDTQPAARHHPDNVDPAAPPPEAHEPWGRWCSKDTIYKSYVSYCTTIRRGAFQTKPSNEFWKLMMSMNKLKPTAAALDGDEAIVVPAFDKPLKRVVRAFVNGTMGRQTIRLVRMPSLQQCRQGWRENTVMQGEWEAHHD